ncbi:MAG: hypothetical protein K2M04_01255 [Muribaculaceae bacterium]|nr:hypothetical protein [Muribaculaceae bacterium]
MKKISLISFVISLMTVIPTSCTLHEYPEGAGEDPTEVIVNATLNLKLKLPQRDEYQPTSGRPISDYSHRFVIEAVGESYRTEERQEIFVPDDGTETELFVPVNMRLHARNYKLMVWSDYVRTDEPEKDLFYDVETLTPVLPVKSYIANTDYKDAFDALAELDLRPYASSWQEKVMIDVELVRPVGRYELITTDVAAFQRRVASGMINGTTFTARLRYAGYIATGYNVMEQTPKNMLNFISYQSRLSNVTTTEEHELRIAFDYIMCTPEGTIIPAELEIINENNEIVSNCPINIQMQAGYNTTIKGRFLTVSSEGGVNVDPDYDGTLHVDLGIL